MANEIPETFCDLDTTVPVWIIEHPETLGVFQEFGIDYSCGGKSLGYVCDQKGMDRMMVLERLHRTIKASANGSGEEGNDGSPCESGECD